MEVTVEDGERTEETIQDQLDADDDMVSKIPVETSTDGHNWALKTSTTEWSSVKWIKTAGWNLMMKV